MTEYELLLDESYNEGIEVFEMPLESDSMGLCDGSLIALNTRFLYTSVQKRYFLSEEVWHYRVTVGDITDTTNVSNLKQEYFARKCNILDVASPDKIVKALLCTYTEQEFCDYLGIPVEALPEIITFYKNKYGLYYRCKDYTLYFEPLSTVGSSIKGDENI